MDSIHLDGAESVRSASHTISSAADTMRSAASDMSQSLGRHSEQSAFMIDAMDRQTEALDRHTESLNKFLLLSGFDPENPNKVTTFEFKRVEEPVEPVTTDNRMQLQTDEFDACVALIKAYGGLAPIVDDDYPETRHRYESALRVFLKACRANGRTIDG